MDTEGNPVGSLVLPRIQTGSDVGLNSGMTTGEGERFVSTL